MMVDPPIDKMIDKSGSKYALVVAMAKRARTLEAKENDELEEKKIKSISYACKEYADDKIKILRD